MRLVSLGLGGLLADRLGIVAVYLLGGALLALAGALGLALLGGLPLDRAPMSSCGGWCRWSELVDRGLVQAAGTTRDRRYVLAGDAIGPAIHRMAQ